MWIGLATVMKGSRIVRFGGSFLVAALIGGSIAKLTMSAAPPKQRAPQSATVATVAARNVGSKGGAFNFCKRAVEASLKAPSTAKFQSVLGATISQYGDETFSVESYVDSQNGFGAMLRSNYICTVTYLGGNRWRLDGFELKAR